MLPLNFIGRNKYYGIKEKGGMTEMMFLGWVWQKEMQGKIFANFNMIFKKANKNNNNKRLEENIQGDLLHR